MPALKFAAGTVERDEAVKLKCRQIARCEDHGRFALRIEMKEVLREAIVPGRKRARRNARFKPGACLNIGAGELSFQTGAHIIFLEDFFKRHAHAFTVADHINHFSSPRLGIAGENSRSAAATLWYVSMYATMSSRLAGGAPSTV